MKIKKQIKTIQDQRNIRRNSKITNSKYNRDRTHGHQNLLVKMMWVSSMTSPHTNGATNCGGHSQSITQQQNLPNRQCSQCRLAATTINSSSKMSPSTLTSSPPSSSSTAWTGIQFTLHRAIYVFAAIILLNTVGLFSVALADTMQYPVTASIGGSLIPPGKRLLIQAMQFLSTLVFFSQIGFSSRVLFSVNCPISLSFDYLRPLLSIASHFHHHYRPYSFFQCMCLYFRPCTRANTRT